MYFENPFYRKKDYKLAIKQGCGPKKLKKVIQIL